MVGWLVGWFDIKLDQRNTFFFVCYSFEFWFRSKLSLALDSGFSDYRKKDTAQNVQTYGAAPLPSVSGEEEIRGEETCLVRQGVGNCLNQLDGPDLS